MTIIKLADVLCQDILLHPFIKLRRTCEVNRRCSPFICVHPFSLPLFLYHQQRNQGIVALYKGLSSELLVKGIKLGTEAALANHAEWPREIDSRSKSFFEDCIKVLALRGLSIALCTPLLCTAVIETVQSVIVVRDRPSFVDCLKDGLTRLTHLRLTPSNRMLPIWLLIVPTVFYHVSHTAIWHLSKAFIDFVKVNFMPTNPKQSRNESIVTKTRASRTIPKTTIMDPDSVSWRGDLSMNRTPVSWTEEASNTERSLLDTSTEAGDIELDCEQISKSILASLIADIIMLPVETVLNSLYIQGTRTIIDNCDETTVVLPVLTNYDGFSDCYQSILRFEGNLGLYKGLGAIILQYSIHYMLFRSLYFLQKR